MDSQKRDFPSLFADEIGKPLDKSVPLQEHTHFRIGGNADYFFNTYSSTELIQSVRFAKKFSFPYYIIGGGYNIFFDDEGFRGLIIKNQIKGIKRIQKTAVEVFAGTALADVLQFCIDEGLGGLEFLAGIPGTVGGAVFGNAGAFDQDIGSFLKEAFLFDEKGEEIRVEQKYFAFGYRRSLLKTKRDILLKAVFEVHEEDKGKVKARIDDYLMQRRGKHPNWDVACAGSYFKNPVLPSGKKVPAASLLDQVGAKDLRVGEAAVYAGHANFIINRGNASAKDVLSLASELKRLVFKKFGVDLEEEVIFLPARFSTP